MLQKGKVYVIWAMFHETLTQDLSSNWLRIEAP